jgi:hypothetical protein
MMDLAQFVLDQGWGPVFDVTSMPEDTYKLIANARPALNGNWTEAEGWVDQPRAPVRQSLAGLPLRCGNRWPDTLHATPSPLSRPLAGFLGGDGRGLGAGRGQ